MLSIPQRTLLKDLLRLFDRNRSLLEGDRDDAAVPSPGARASGGGGGGASGSGSHSHSHSVSFALPPMAATSAAAPSSAPTAAAATRRSSIIPRFVAVSRKCLLMDSSQLHFLSRDLF
jgi:hypothetical protein